MSDAITSVNFADKSQRKNDERNKHMKTITNIIYPTFALFAFACFALLPAPNAFGVVPAPDGGYPGFNTAEGTNALQSLTTGVGNAAVGWFSLFSNTDGSHNTAVGAGTLLFNSGDQTTGEGTANTAIGTAALLFNTTGFYNTANGALALLNNTEGNFNTAIGWQSLYNNTTGSDNTASGIQALRNNTTGTANTATGADALRGNTTGNYNTANGHRVLEDNTEGNQNTASGAFALSNNTTGSDNTATGANALPNNTEGSHNTANGYRTLESNTEGSDNTATGHLALVNNTTGSSNTALGLNAGLNLTTGSGNVCIGAGIFGVAGESDTTRIRNIYASVANGRAVYVDSDDKIGTLASSRRFKQEIKPMDKASEVLFALKPVSFRYKKEVDPTRSLSFGLIAEEVAEVDPRLVTPDPDGKPETVRYEAVNAMLLNEFLKEHRRIEEQDKRIDQLTTQLKEQALLIQKVNDKMELNRRAPQTVANGR
jgi:trimeric autotransporter adhesin